jgi:hypothetical protein
VGEVIHSPPVLLMLTDNGVHIPRNGKLSDYQNYTLKRASLSATPATDFPNISRVWPALY